MLPILNNNKRKSKEELINLKSIGKINGYFGVARVGRPSTKKICLPFPVGDPFDVSTIFVTPEEADKKKDSSRGGKAGKTPRRLLYENYAREVLAAALPSKYFSINHQGISDR